VSTAAVAHVGANGLYEGVFKKFIVLSSVQRLVLLLAALPLSGLIAEGVVVGLSANRGLVHQYRQQSVLRD
jgi:hypothetical protein